MTFDRLLYIDRLKDAGIAEPLARAHAEALRDAMAETVATKSDLRELAAATKADLRELGGALDAKIEGLDRKIALLDAKLDAKIDVTARDLVIKGAGGLIVLATLMIGLKLFG